MKKDELLKQIKEDKDTYVQKLLQRKRDNIKLLEDRNTFMLQNKHKLEKLAPKYESSVEKSVRMQKKVKTEFGVKNAEEKKVDVPKPNSFDSAKKIKDLKFAINTIVSHISKTDDERNKLVKRIYENIRNIPSDSIAGGKICFENLNWDEISKDFGALDKIFKDLKETHEKISTEVKGIKTEVKKEQNAGEIKTEKPDNKIKKENPENQDPKQPELYGIQQEPPHIIPESS